MAIEAHEAKMGAHEWSFCMKFVYDCKPQQWSLWGGLSYNGVPLVLVSPLFRCSSHSGCDPAGVSG